MKILIPNFAKRGGVIPVVVQDYSSHEILMLVYTNEACFLETIKTGQAVYFSSGDTQRVVSILIDCDGDALVYKVKTVGNGCCHTKARSCFYRTIDSQRVASGVDKKREKKKDQLKMKNVPKVGIGYKISRVKIPGGEEVFYEL